MLGLSPILLKSKPQASASGALAKERINGTHSVRYRHYRFKRLALEVEDGDALVLFAEEKTSVHLKYILIYSLNVMRLPQRICSAFRSWPASVVEEAVLPYMSIAIFSETLQRKPSVKLLSF